MILETKKVYNIRNIKHVEMRCIKETLHHRKIHIKEQMETLKSTSGLLKRLEGELIVIENILETLEEVTA